jgi:hypothetical protein
LVFIVSSAPYIKKPTVLPSMREKVGCHPFLINLSALFREKIPLESIIGQKIIPENILFL